MAKLTLLNTKYYFKINIDHKSSNFEIKIHDVNINSIHSVRYQVHECNQFSKLNLNQTLFQHQVTQVQLVSTNFEPLIYWINTWKSDVDFFRDYLFRIIGQQTQNWWSNNEFQIKMWLFKCSLTPSTVLDQFLKNRRINLTIYQLQLDHHRLLIKQLI